MASFDFFNYGQSTLRTWSYNEDKKDKILDTFPCPDGFEEEDNFITAVRSCFRGVKAKRDDNDETIIKLPMLNLYFEDVARKESGEEFSMIGQCRKKGIKSTDGVVSLRYSPLITQEGEGIILEDKEFQNGFFEGELTTYYSVPKPTHNVKVKVQWGGLEDLSYEQKQNIIFRISLYQNGEVLSSVKFNATSDFEYTFVDQKKFDDNGNLYQYKIVEEVVSKTSFGSWQITTEENTDFTLENGNYFIKFTNLLKKQNRVLTYGILKNFKGNNTELGNWMFSLKTADGIAKWENEIKESSGFNTMENNSVALFYALYSWEDENGRRLFNTIPFITIVSKDGGEKFYHFRFFIKDDGYGDEDNRRYVYRNNYERNYILFPFNSSINDSGTVGYGGGTMLCRVNKGTIWNTDNNGVHGRPGEWINPYRYAAPQDIKVYKPGYSNEQGILIGTPIADLSLGSVLLNINNGQIGLSNFLIYISDKTCLGLGQTDGVNDSVESVVPYFYECQLSKQIDSNNIGEIEATIKYNIKNFSSNEMGWQLNENDSYINNSTGYGNDYLLTNFSKITHDYEEQGGKEDSFLYRDNNRIYNQIIAPQGEGGDI